jgi:FMN reductase
MNGTKSSRRHITVVSAGVGEPSTTTKLAEGIAEKTAQQLQHDGHAAQVNVIELKNLAKDIAIASVSWRISPELQAALDIVVNSMPWLRQARCSKPHIQVCSRASGT